MAKTTYNSMSNIKKDGWSCKKCQPTKASKRRCSEADDDLDFREEIMAQIASTVQKEVKATVAAVVAPAVKEAIEGLFNTLVYPKLDEIKERVGKLEQHVSYLQDELDSAEQYSRKNNANSVRCNFLRH